MEKEIMEQKIGSQAYFIWSIWITSRLQAERILRNGDARRCFA